MRCPSPVYPSRSLSWADKIPRPHWLEQNLHWSLILKFKCRTTEHTTNCAPAVSVVRYDRNIHLTTGLEKDRKW